SPSTSEVAHRASRRSTAGRETARFDRRTRPAGHEETLARGSGSARALDEVPHLGVNRRSPAPAAEDAVVPRPVHDEVALLGVGDVGAELEGRLGLTEAGDVVELPFDREEGGLVDG